MSNAYEFDEIAQNIFYPIYSMIADMIKRDTKIIDGRCIDIGCGGGHLGFEIMKITNLDMIFLDNNKEALDIARKRCEEFQYNDRSKMILSSVENMPIKDESCDLIVSRGSLWFWEDKVKSFNEIVRVLRNEGIAYVGCGFGNEEVRREIYRKMNEVNGEDWEQRRKKFTTGNDIEFYTKILNECKIRNFRIKDDEEGLWIIINK